MMEINVGDQVFDFETQNYAIVACRDFLTPIGTPFDWGIRLLDEENNQSTMIIGRDDRYLHRTNKFNVSLNLREIVTLELILNSVSDYDSWKELKTVELLDEESFAVLKETVNSEVDRYRNLLAERDPTCGHQKHEGHTCMTQEKTTT